MFQNILPLVIYVKVVRKGLKDDLIDNMLNCVPDKRLISGILESNSKMIIKKKQNK